ncbi:MAG: hypothetical protein ACRDGS_00020, partial [Chloroflexota bacterium]
MSDSPSVITGQAAGSSVPVREIDAGDLFPRRPRLWRRFARHRLALASLCLVATLALLGILSSLISPYDPYAQNFDPTILPSGAHWLGTDELGRDEL